MSDTETLANAAAFRGSLEECFRNNLAATTASSASKLDQAYVRLTVLQAWRAFVLEERFSKGALGFFSEAQNDGLTSLVLATSGLWRPALKSLRSLIENILHCLYYADHPVEYLRWEAGKYRPTFKSMFEYFESHPYIVKVGELSAVADLRQHYSALSDAVHSSSVSLRMTDDLLKSNLWKADAASIGKWTTLQKAVLKDTNLLLLILLSEHAQGASVKGLRDSLAHVIPARKDAQIRTALGVRISR